MKVDNPLLTNIENLVDLQIDGIDYKDVNGVKYSKGDSLKINLTHNIHSNPLLKYNFYKIRPILYFKDSEGNVLTYRVSGFYVREPISDFLEIIKYLRVNPLKRQLNIQNI